jgi:hypothetical protein
MPAAGAGVPREAIGSALFLRYPFPRRYAHV